MTQPVVNYVTVQNITDFDPKKPGNAKYPWKETAVGQSFAFPNTIKHPEAQISQRNKKPTEKWELRTKDNICYAHRIG